MLSWKSNPYSVVPKTTGNWKYICIWARSWENLSYVICERQRHRSACASAYVVRCLHCLHSGIYIKIKHNRKYPRHSQSKREREREREREKTRLIFNLHGYAFFFFFFCCCCFLFSFRGGGFISRRFLVGTGCSVLTLIVLPHLSTCIMKYMYHDKCLGHLSWYHTQSHYSDTGSTSPSSTS